MQPESTKPCKQYGSVKGCNKGDNCLFDHNHPETIPLCLYYDRPTACPSENYCKFRHKVINIKPKLITKKLTHHFDHIFTGYLRQYFIVSTTAFISYDIIKIFAQYFVDDLIIEQYTTTTLDADKPHFFHNIIIKSHATLTTNNHNKLTNKGGKLIIHAMNKILLKPTAKICLNGLGYNGGIAVGHGYNGNGIGGGFNGITYGGGAGYGCKGNKHVFTELSGNGGQEYGTIDMQQLYLGSGGGSSNTSNGSNGGGVLVLLCNKLELHRRSMISCDGETDMVESIVKNEENENKNSDIKTSGGGSGGSIFIECDQLIMAIGSRIQTRGGKRGGYGRIRIDCKKKIVKIANDINKIYLNIGSNIDIRNCFGNWTKCVIEKRKEIGEELVIRNVKGNNKEYVAIYVVYFLEGLCRVEKKEWILIKRNTYCYCDTKCEDKEHRIANYDTQSNNKDEMLMIYPKPFWGI